VVYSDLGFIALGILLTRMTGHPLTDMARNEIFEPLDLKQTFFNPEVALQTGIAACETGNAYERDMIEQSGAGVYQNSRQRLIWGEVHDGNAYFLGGAAGAIANLDLEYKPGTRVVYSDLGFIALGILLARMTGHSLADMAHSEIFEPLGLQQTFFNPEEALQTGIAACETGNAYECAMIEQSGAGAYQNSRQRLIWGEVHDGNAYFLGGAAGHAGLFSNAADTFTLAHQFLPESSKLLTRETCALFRTNMTPGLEESRSLAWQLAETSESTAGLDLPRDSFGHNGFTGTCLWIDPDHTRVFILLTNRTHARALPFANINAVRREFNSLASKALN
jgi:CubicO group peptidase (beta-lactamase class C family)